MNREAWYSRQERLEARQLEMDELTEHINEHCEPENEIVRSISTVCLISWLLVIVILLLFAFRIDTLNPRAC